MEQAQLQPHTIRLLRRVAWRHADEFLRRAGLKRPTPAYHQWPGNIAFQMVNKEIDADLVNLGNIQQSTKENGPDGVIIRNEFDAILLDQVVTFLVEDRNRD